MMAPRSVLVAAVCAAALLLAGAASVSVSGQATRADCDFYWRQLDWCDKFGGKSEASYASCVRGMRRQTPQATYCHAPGRDPDNDHMTWDPDNLLSVGFDAPAAPSSCTAVCRASYAACLGNPSAGFNPVVDCEAQRDVCLKMCSLGPTNVAVEVTAAASGPKSRMHKMLGSSAPSMVGSIQDCLDSCDRIEDKCIAGIPKSCSNLVECNTRMQRQCFAKTKDCRNQCYWSVSNESQVAVPSTLPLADPNQCAVKYQQEMQACSDQLAKCGQSMACIIAAQQCQSQALTDMQKCGMPSMPSQKPQPPVAPSVGRRGYP